MKYTLPLFIASWLSLAAVAPARSDFPTRELAVAAVDAESGDLLPDAVVHYYREQYRTDEQSQILVPLVIKSHGTYFIIRAEGYTPRRISWRSTDPTDYPPAYKVSMTKGVTIGGRVVDPQGNPVSGATVYILGTGSDMAEDVRPFEDKPFVVDEQVTTDADGRWSYREFPAGRTDASLRISHPDFISDAGYTRSGNFPALTAGEDLHVLQQGGRISGVVTDPDGNPVAEALVFPGESRFGTNHGETRTDASGAFSLPPLPAEPTVITVVKPGFAPALTVIKPDDPPPVAITLKPGHAVELTVTDPSGQPVPDAWVMPDSWLENEGAAPPRNRYRTLADISRATHDAGDLRYDKRTDADGVFRWTWAPQEPVLFSVIKPGWISERDVVLSAAEPRQTLTLYPEVVVTGRVTDRETGEPIPTFTVDHARGQPGRKPNFLTQFAVEGRDGQYRIRFDERAAAYWVRITAPGYRPAMSDAIKPEDGAVAFDAALERGPTVSVTVEDATGAPRSGLTVFRVTEDRAMIDYSDAHSANRMGSHVYAVTDPRGVATFNVPEKAFVLLAFSDEGIGTIDGKDAMEGQPLRLQAWATVEVAVFKDGQPVAGKFIHFDPLAKDHLDIQFMQMSLSNATGPDGIARLTRVPPGRVNIAVETSSVGIQGKAGREVTFGQPRQIEAKPGETATVRYDL